MSVSKPSPNSIFNKYLQKLHLYTEFNDTKVYKDIRKEIYEGVKIENHTKFNNSGIDRKQLAKIKNFQRKNLLSINTKLKILKTFPESNRQESIIVPQQTNFKKSIVPKKKKLTKFEKAVLFPKQKDSSNPSSKGLARFEKALAKPDKLSKLEILSNITLNTEGLSKKTLQKIKEIKKKQAYLQNSLNSIVYPPQEDSQNSLNSIVHPPQEDSQNSIVLSKDLEDSPMVFQDPPIMLEDSPMVLEDSPMVLQDPPTPSMNFVEEPLTVKELLERKKQLIINRKASLEK